MKAALGRRRPQGAHSLPAASRGTPVREGSSWPHPGPLPWGTSTALSLARAWGSFLRQPWAKQEDGAVRGWPEATAPESFVLTQPPAWVRGGEGGRPWQQGVVPWAGSGARVAGLAPRSGQDAVCLGPGGSLQGPFQKGGPRCGWGQRKVKAKKQ